MSADRIKEIEEKIDELKTRMPDHSVPMSILLELDELEEGVEMAKKGSG